jgi:hypothetical protein
MADDTPSSAFLDEFLDMLRRRLEKAVWWESNLSAFIERGPNGENIGRASPHYVAVIRFTDPTREDTQ